MSILGYQGQDVKLIYNLFKMNLRDRYLGSVLGLFWAVLNPLILFGMYTFVFGFIFKAKLPGAETSLGYTIWLISGFVPYLAISDCLTTTPSSIVSQANLVKNIVFKTETLPISATLIGIVPFCVGISFLLTLLIVDGNYPTWHVIGLIPVVFLQFGFLAGLGLFLGATTVFIRDISQVVATLTLLIVFFTPIFYPLEILPLRFRTVTFLNPFYQMIKPYRQVLLQHQWPEWGGLLYLAALSVFLILLGLRYFRGLKGYFEMVL